MKKDEDWLSALDRRLMDWFWAPDRRLNLAAKWGFFVLKVAYLALRNSYKDRLPFSANALTFITLLGLVPALAISFSVAKGLGISDALNKLLLDNEFLASQQEVMQQIIGYVQRTEVGTVGVLGLVLLIFTLLLAISSVEEAFNRIWEVAAQRSWLRKFTDYFSVMVIFPLLVFAAAASWAQVSSHALVRWLMNVSMVGEMAQQGINLGPFFLLAAAFIFIYLFLPNTRIPIRSALVAGIITAALWWGVQSLYIFFQVGAARYNAIYGGFASLPLFMIWVQVSWNVVLFGAELAHAHQVCLHGPLPRYVYPPLTTAQREGLGLRIMFRLARRFHRGEDPPSLSNLARELKMPLGEVQNVVRTLMETGLVKEAGPEGEVQPGRSLSTVTLADVWAAMRGASHSELCRAEQPSDAEMLAWLDRAATAGQEELAQRNLQQLAEQAEKENSDSNSQLEAC
jgi:membrane protein